jgi:hypothetical protein
LASDLHIHTYHSDSTLSPIEIAEYAQRIGLSAIGITDHDTIEGLEPALEAGRRCGVEVIPGVEFSLVYGDEEVHLIGYLVDWKNHQLVERLRLFQGRRRERFYEMCERLDRVGVRVSPDEILKAVHGSSIGRLHIASYLYKKGITETIQDAFKRYLSRDGPCYVEKFRFSIEEGVELTLASGGIPVLAHPWYVDAEAIVKRLKPLGLAGIEVYHPEHTTRHVRLFKSLAKEYNLIITGGSDCHGLNKEKILIGSVVVDDGVLVRLKEAREGILS